VFAQTVHFMGYTLAELQPQSVKEWDWADINASHATAVDL